MGKPESWQVKQESYPFSHLTETRFADIDILGHINNVAMAGLFEHGRGMFNHAIEVSRRAPGQRWLIARVEINYLAEAHFPEKVDIASGIARIGNSSWDIASAAFQGGECKAVCITTIVLTDDNGSTPINVDLRGEFERLSIKTSG
jgi:acyl-CoA thioester hydrolase